MLVLKNRHLVARFNPETGMLSHLTKTGRGRSLVGEAFCRYSLVEPTQWFGRNYAGGEDNVKPFKVLSVDATDDAVVTTVQSKHITVTIRWELPKDSPLLKVHATTRGRGVKGELKYTALPHIELDDGYNDTFEDEVDLYCDGAEIARGRELPCWRVFFRKGRRDGLMLATRAKVDMAHFNILANSFDAEPQCALNYSSHPVFSRPALDATRRKPRDMRFEIGPWQKTSHAKLIKAANLDKPVAVDHPEPRGKPTPASRLKGKVFDARTVAAKSAVSKTWHPRKWMIASMPWARKGKALFATTDVNAPPIRLDPKLKGLYHVYLGIGDGPGATLRVTGDPELRYRIVSGKRGTPDAFGLALSGKHKPAELDFGVIRMDGKKVSIGRHPDLQMPCTIDYIRFEKLTPAAARRWEKQEMTEPVLPLSGLADTPDISVILDAANPDPGAVRSVIWEHANTKVRKCYWRVDGQCSDFPAKSNTMRYPSAKVHGVFSPHSKAYGRLLRRCDILKVTSDAARKYGVSLYAWMRFNNYSGNVQSDFYKNNPHLWEEWEHGTKGRKLCIAHSEVRAHKIGILLEAVKYGLAGINLGFLRHPPILLYAKVMRDAYKRKYGKLPPRDPKHPDALHRSSLPKRKNQREYERWWKFRAGYLTIFGRELKAALNKEGFGHLPIAVWVRPNHCLFDGIDLPMWLDEGLCNEVVTMHYGSDIFDRDLSRETPGWKKMVQAKVPLIRTIEPWNNGADIRAEVKRILAGGYDGICSYESNDTVMDTNFIQLFRGLRR